jgi:hypothetical protein
VAKVVAKVVVNLVTWSLLLFRIASLFPIWVIDLSKAYYGHTVGITTVLYST